MNNFGVLQLILNVNVEETRGTVRKRIFFLPRAPQPLVGFDLLNNSAPSPPILVNSPALSHNHHSYASLVALNIAWVI